MCQVIVKGSQNLLIRVFDENVKDEIIKTITRSEFDASCTLDGKDVKVKLGSSKKEVIDTALKQLKDINETFKIESSSIRHKMKDTSKKLEKILPQEEVKILVKDFEKICLAKEVEAKKLMDAKEKEIKSA